MCTVMFAHIKWDRETFASNQVHWKFIFYRQKQHTINPTNTTWKKNLALVIQTFSTRNLIIKYYILRKTQTWVEMLMVHCTAFSLLTTQRAKQNLRTGFLYTHCLISTKLMQFTIQITNFLAFFFLNAIDGHYVQLVSQVLQEQNPCHQKQDAWMHHQTYATNDEQCVLES